MTAVHSTRSKEKSMKKLSLGLALVAALSVSAVALASGSPGVKFVTPKAGATTKSKVTFTVKLSNFKIDAKDVGKMKKAHMGHLHFAMDKGKYDYPKYSGANGKLAVMLGIAGKYSPAVTPSITYANLPKGKHTLVVMLANNDHSPQGAKASITFRVK
jgi:hypothetical protein